MAYLLLCMEIINEKAQSYCYIMLTEKLFNDIIFVRVKFSKIHSIIRKSKTNIGKERFI